MNLALLGVYINLTNLFNHIHGSHQSYKPLKPYIILFYKEPLHLKRSSWTNI